jgi:hypothetical protein
MFQFEQPLKILSNVMRRVRFKIFSVLIRGQLYKIFKISPRTFSFDIQLLNDKLCTTLYIFYIYLYFIFYIHI